MILRAAIIVLLVLNLGVAAWWISGGDAVSRNAEAAMPAGTPGLRLVSEAARPPPAPVTAAAPAPAPAPPAAPEPQATATNVVQCLRFGPFADAAARDAARASLSAAGVASEPRDTPARTGRGWKVHVPPFASRDEAKAMGEKIKAAGASFELDSLHLLDACSAIIAAAEDAQSIDPEKLVAAIDDGVAKGFEGSYGPAVWGSYPDIYGNNHCAQTQMMMTSTDKDGNHFEWVK